MKLNKLCRVIVAVVGFASSGAFAAGLNLNGIDPARPADSPGLVINFSGSSSSDKSFGKILGNLCVPDTLSVYTDQCSLSTDKSSQCSLSSPKYPGNGYSAYFCIVDRTKIASWSGSTNVKVLFRKRSAGGSGWGVQPVASATPIAQMALNPTNCKVTATANVFKCGSTTENVVSDMGVSDVEPALFKAPNVPAGFSSITTAQIANLDVKTIAAQTFGIPVTNALYGALQEAQGLESDLDGDNIVEGQSENVTDDQVLTNIPSLTREQVGMLLNGSVNVWSQVFFGSNNLMTIASNSGLPVPYPEVTICRRVDGSGSQAVVNALFLNVPCSTSAGLPATHNAYCHDEKGKQNLSDSDCTAGGAWARFADERGVQVGEAAVFATNSSSDMENCLEDLQNYGRWAIGLQSLEKQSTKYSYLKINGVAPTLWNVASGSYMDWATGTMQYRKVTTNGIPAPAGNAKAIMNQLRTDFQNPALLKWVNDTFASNFGRVGLLSTTATPVVPFNVTQISFGFNPIMQITRGASSMATCNAPASRYNGFNAKL